MVCRKVDVSVSFTALLCVYYYLNPLNSFLPFVLSAALHEAGHLVALRACGVEVKKIRLRALGVQIETPPLPYRKELPIALAGPVSNLLLLLLVGGRVPLLALVNLCLFAYNLLPVYPLDGGRILRALLSILFTEYTVHILLKVIGTVCLALVCGLGCYLTCVWHAGLWPILAVAMLILRLTETILPEEIKLCV